MPLYRLVVAYDGSRFNGFQRQMTNNAMTERRGQQTASSPAQSSSSSPAPPYRPPKRPHWHADTGKRKGVPITVQECLEEALLDYCRDQNQNVATSASTFTVEELCLKFAGRTDKGVHARGQVIAVQLPIILTLTANGGDGGGNDDDRQLVRCDLHDMKKGINSRLPFDISIEKMELCLNDTFDPRRDVRRKMYSYTIKYRRKLWVVDEHGNKSTVLPICQLGLHSFRHALDPPCLWVCPWALDDQPLPELCQRLQGEHDYFAFVHRNERHEGGRSHVMTVDRITLTLSQIISQDDDEEAPVIVARMEFEAQGFRRSMIRNLVGYCVDVCRGQIPLMDWDTLWSGTDDVASKVNAAPASGLCLERVSY